jgi:Zn-dependent M28 family amino/carboxypeptidase
MANVMGKARGATENILLLLSHYDTKQLPDVPDFSGANDGGSSTGVLLELARILCSSSRKNQLTPWIVFTDGEEAFVEWSDTDGTYGSRQLAAQMALSGELKRVKAVILADLVGDKELRFKREENSTDWLVDLVWKVGRDLGYGEHFLDETTNIEDDHVPFLKRGVPAVDIIDLDSPWWHTGGDTLDKISARSLGVTGHVILETISALEKKLK